MLLYETAAAAVHSRTAVVPAHDAECSTEGNSGVDALALFHIKKRDKLDYAVDFSAWLQANGNATLTSATFAVTSDSPQTPILAGQAYSPAGKAVVVLSPANDARAGDAYYLDVTAQVAATAATLPTDVAIPARIIVRRIHIVVANG